MPRCTREFKVDDKAEIKVGDKVLGRDFAPGDKVNVTGISKGKGFQGVVKRHHFRGGAATHGSMFHRAPGSIGASAFPSRVVKGMRAAGHMGQDRVTVKNLRVVEVDAENNLLVVRGALPGGGGAYLVFERRRGHGSQQDDEEAGAKGRQEQGEAGSQKDGAGEGRSQGGSRAEAEGAAPGREGGCQDGEGQKGAASDRGSRAHVHRLHRVPRGFGRQRPRSAS